MGNRNGSRPPFDPHRRLPAEHAVAVAAKLGEMHHFTHRLIQRLAAIGYEPGVETYDRIAAAHDAIGAAKRYSTDPFAEPPTEPGGFARRSRPQSAIAFSNPSPTGAETIATCSAFR